MVVGVMPGLGPSAGLAILLPITFRLDPTGAVVMLAAVYYGAMYGGTITSVLINTPGESATVASTFDGYPLAKQGRAGPALVMAAVASFVAGTIGAILISVAAPVTAVRRRDASARRSCSWSSSLGLLTLIVIVGKNRLLGALSALIGFAIATVGIDIGAGQQRYTFGSVELINGIDFIPVAIGLFGVGEILHTLWRGGHLEKLGYFNVCSREQGLLADQAGLAESAGPITRGSFLGFFVGATPGAGATVASLMSYNLEKSISKTPEKFGKGAMAGLVGPEAANNAASSGAMVPLLTLGIPGSGADRRAHRWLPDVGPAARTAADGAEPGVRLGPDRQHVPRQHDAAAGQHLLHPGVRQHRPGPVPGARPDHHRGLRRSARSPSTAASSRSASCWPAACSASSCGASGCPRRRW